MIEFIEQNKEDLFKCYLFSLHYLPLYFQNDRENVTDAKMVELTKTLKLKNYKWQQFDWGETELTDLVRSTDYYFMFFINRFCKMTFNPKNAKHTLAHMNINHFLLNRYRDDKGLFLENLKYIASEIDISAEEIERLTQFYHQTQDYHSFELAFYCFVYYQNRDYETGGEDLKECNNHQICEFYLNNLTYFDNLYHQFNIVKDKILFLFNQMAED